MLNRIVLVKFQFLNYLLCSRVCRISNYGDSRSLWHELWWFGCLWSGLSPFIQIFINILWVMSKKLQNIWLTFFGFCEERHALRMFFQGMNLKNVWIFRLVTAFRTGVEQIVVTIVVQTWVVYMCSSFLQLAPGSRDLFQAEK